MVLHKCEGQTWCRKKQQSDLHQRKSRSSQAVFIQICWWGFTKEERQVQQHWALRWRRQAVQQSASCLPSGGELKESYKRQEASWFWNDATRKEIPVWNLLDLRELAWLGQRARLRRAGPLEKASISNYLSANLAHVIVVKSLSTSSSLQLEL